MDGGLVEARTAAHKRFAVALGSVPPEVRRLFVMLQRRVVTESLAHVQPVLPADALQVDLPPPRAFLTIGQRRRMDGAAAALRHLDSRAAMARMGAIGSVLHAATPCVLHALLEGPNPAGRETNPGMYRATPTSWHAEVNPFRHPPAEQVDHLTGEAVAMALAAPAPAIARASWLAFTVMCVHPFVDGNGRVARALALAVAVEDTSTGLDWGLPEQWSVRRGDYVAALQAGQRCGSYDAAALDAAPFVEFGLRTSTDGAQQCRRRLDVLARWFEQEPAGLPPLHRALLVAAAMERGITRDGLGALADDGEVVRQAVNELLHAGLLSWAPRPASRREDGGDVRWQLVASRPVATASAGTPAGRR
ncbi:MAG: Fic family protein [Ilumatobacter sp.]|nr:Fic family protein [Ilumatobacter sp.]